MTEHPRFLHLPTFFLVNRHQQPRVPDRATQWQSAGRVVLAVIAALLCTALLCTAHAARGQTLSVEPSDDACLHADALRARLQHWLAGHPIDPTLSVVVHAAAEAPWFIVQRAVEPLAERRFDTLPASCEERRDALTLAIVIALEQATGAQPQLTAPVVPIETYAVAHPPTDAPPDRTVDRHDRLRVHAAALVKLGVLPVTALALGLGVEVPIAAEWRLHVTGIATPTTEVVVGGARTDMNLASVRALFCAPLLAGNITVEACAGGLAGVVWARGVDYARNTTATLGVVSMLGRAALRWPANSPVSLRLAFDLSLQWLRPQLEVGSQQPAASTGSWLGAVTSAEAIITL